MENNLKFCDFEVLKVQVYYDVIVLKFNDIKRNKEMILKQNLGVKNVEFKKKKIDLEKKKE